MEDNKVLEIKETKGIMIISPLTDFDMTLEKRMDDIYHDACERGIKKIVFTFNTDYNITSGGMAILFGLIRESQKRDQEIGIANLSNHFQKTFQMVGITRYITIYNSLEEALEKMSQPCYI